MPRKWRPILATFLVLAFALFAYVHSAARSLDILSPTFKFDQDDGKLQDIPAEIRQLDGQIVTVEGYMIPMDQADQVKEFALVPYLWEFNYQAPGLTQIVVATAKPGYCMSYTADPIRISGRLHVRVTKDEGYIVSIFDMDVEHTHRVYAGPFVRWPWFILGGIPAILTLLMFRRWFKRRRLRRTGHCIRCGYDLRATPARCPECGRATTVTIPA